MPSKIDHLFNEVFGSTPTKAGAAFEILSAIVTHVLWGGEVTHDSKIRGKFSKTLYQLDVFHRSDSLSSMGEVKDYTIKGDKVGRADLQKLGGALPDIKDIDFGTFFSATGYTAPAKKYAQNSEHIIGKQIFLYVLRPSTELDEMGFIKTIVVDIHICSPDQKNSKWIPHFTKNGNETLKGLLQSNEKSTSIDQELSFFYDSKGNNILSLYDLTSNGFCDINMDTGKSHACFALKNHYIKVKDALAEIYGVEYEIPYNYEKQELRITDDRNNRLVLLDRDGNIISLVTDDQLKEYDIDSEGNLFKKLNLQGK